jgi:quercetin dioxygenase-like cupin family protein
MQNLLTARARTADAVGVEAAHAVALLNPLPPWRGDFPPSQSPLLAYSDAALANCTAPETSVSALPVAELLAAVAPLRDYLPWKYNYAPRADFPELGQKMGWAELVGPEAPGVSTRVCLGLTLVAPHSYYPRHRHPATELYFVIGGAAEWELNGAAKIQPPGSFILHPSNEIHAVKTGAAPLFALYTWTGADVVTLSSYVAEP